MAPLSAADAASPRNAAPTKNRYVVAVRALCEFTAKEGDLDLRFTPAPSAQEGIAGHGVVTSRRGPAYQSELSLSGSYQHLTVRGRADGFDAESNLLEEIKTFRGDLDLQPANHRVLHWAQARVYGWLLCQSRGLAQLRIALVYFDVGTQQETSFIELHSALELQRHFEGLCNRFLQWSAQEMAHRSARDAALTSLRFPHADFRPGQRELAEAVYRAAAHGRCLMAQASTGIGKTIGTLFPLLKACAGRQIDKLFFLAAKTPGRGLALEALRIIKPAASELPLRVIELVARDKACEHPDKACHGASCPLAKGFYDRLPAARSAALELGFLDKESLRRAALSHQVCPYYLSQELVRWGDVIVGDYNYYFDLNALLHGLTQANQWRVGVLVDEAHNLIERGRKMYSAELSQPAFKAVRNLVPGDLKPAFDRLQRRWSELNTEQAEPYQVYPQPPQSFVAALQSCTSAIATHLLEHPVDTTAAQGSGLLRFYFDALHFNRMLELLDGHSQFDVTVSNGPANHRNGTQSANADSSSAEPSDDAHNGQYKAQHKPNSVLCVRNIIPAPFLRERFQAAHSTTLFSATLSPQQFYIDTLGLPERTAWVDVVSPFTSDQLAIRVVHQVSTRYQHRDTSLAPIVELMARQYSEELGNYLAFFSSFDYLQQVLSLFRRQHPHIASWEQSRGMDEAARDQFLARFTPEGRGIGFAVLGGSFAEGIDLPGRRLIGAFIATLGLPQVNAVNEKMRERLEASFGSGYDYTYLFPGMQKVVQAAGRVIRTTTDRGIVYLIDDRFRQPKVMQLLPRWWQLEVHVATPANAPPPTAGVES